MLGSHHRGIMKSALATGGVFYPISHSHFRSLGTLRDLGYFEKVDGADLWALTRIGVRMAEDMVRIDARK